MGEYIQKMLSLSTVHVMPETLERIQAGAFDWLICYRKEHPNNSDEVYGAFINLADINLDEGSSDVRDVPEDLLMVLNYADSFDVHWIMFDCDADEIGELCTYRESWDKLFM